jgi:UDP:flavonoid glycosyltransferase YjiC (YdhE family)
MIYGTVLCVAVSGLALPFVGERVHSMEKRIAMRILFTTLQRHGHFQPLVPIALAAVAAGHEVAVACAASFSPYVERAGFHAFSAGFDNRARSMPEMFPGFLTIPEHAIASWLIPNVIVAIYAAAMTPDLLAIARDWTPDLIVRDAMEYGGCLAAETRGLPHAAVRTGSTTSRYGLRHLIAAPLARLREVNGLPPDPDVAMPFRYLHLAAEPPGFALPGEEAAPTTHWLRPIGADQFGADQSGDATLPAWVTELPLRPTIYATLGTVFNTFPSGHTLFAAILAALREEPVNLIVTVGRDIDPAQFGPQPPHVHIERYIPQHLLLPRCDLVISHGGFNTITGTLNAGRPMIVVPISADQPYNAECCAALGVGRVLGLEERTPEAIAAAVRAVLRERSYRERAVQLRDAMAMLPGPEHAVTLLERLAVEQYQRRCRMGSWPLLVK